MPNDARLSTGLPNHPKTKKLLRRLGQAAGWNLVCLILWAAANRSDGDLEGMSNEDIELAAEWDGEAGLFVRTLADVRFLDGGDGEYTLHDWSEHNPWAAGAESRTARAKWNAAKRHHGVAEADRLVPEYAAIRNADSSASSNAGVVRSAAGSNAPSPSPSPSPSPKDNTPPPPKGGRKRSSAPMEEPEGFGRFWAAWPASKRKEARGKCAQVWVEKGLEQFAEQIVQHVLAKRDRTDWAHSGGQFVEAPLVYLNQGRWEGADLGAAKARQDDDPAALAFKAKAAATPADWWRIAGFDSKYDAEASRCTWMNYTEFRNRERVAPVEGAAA